MYPTLEFILSGKKRRREEQTMRRTLFTHISPPQHWASLISRHASYRAFAVKRGISKDISWPLTPTHIIYVCRVHCNCMILWGSTPNTHIHIYIYICTSSYVVPSHAYHLKRTSSLRKCKFQVPTCKAPALAQVKHKVSTRSPTSGLRPLDFETRHNEVLPNMLKNNFLKGPKGPWSPNSGVKVWSWAPGGPWARWPQYLTGNSEQLGR